MLKTIIIIGTRPEAIKMALLAKELNKRKGIKNYLCVSGQHRSMLDQVLDFFAIKPDFDLNIMQENQQLNDITGKIIIEVSKIYDQINPDLILVHGDTNTCFAAALAAYYKKIPVAHVEAGMRTGNINVPFPEEANRVLTGRISNFHFAPTSLNVKNLIAEGVKRDCIIKTGNTVIDSLIYTSKKIKIFSDQVTDQKLIKAVSDIKKIILVTGHRRENFGGGFKNICLALKNIAIQNPDCYIIYPVHLNPNVQQPVLKALTGINNIILTSPLSYPDFVFLLNRAYLILTDSGGIQEEGPSLGKPVLVMRDITERPEAIQAGTVKLVGTDRKKIEKEVNHLLNDKKQYHKMSKMVNPYGDGKATEKIADWIINNQSRIKKAKPE